MDGYVEGISRLKQPRRQLPGLHFRVIVGHLYQQRGLPGYKLPDEALLGDDGVGSRVY